MAISDLPELVRQNYEIHEWRHASALLKQDFPQEWADIVEVLENFKLYKSYIAIGGGNKTKAAGWIDDYFSRLGWRETKFDTKIVVDQLIYPVTAGKKKKKFDKIDSFDILSPTHLVDEYKNRVAVEVEWNNKDPFFDRDLNNFRLLFELRVISVGVIITRTDELQGLFNELGIGKKYGKNTTHMGKLLPRIEGGGGGGCPVLIFGIKRSLFKDDLPGVDIASEEIEEVEEEE